MTNEILNMEQLDQIAGGNFFYNLPKPKSHPVKEDIIPGPKPYEDPKPIPRPEPVIIPAPRPWEPLA